MNDALDRLYNLLPDVYRDRDERQGFPLRALLMRNMREPETETPPIDEHAPHKL